MSFHLKALLLDIYRSGNEHLVKLKKGKVESSLMHSNILALFFKAYIAVITFKYFLDNTNF